MKQLREKSLGIYGNLSLNVLRRKSDPNTAVISCDLSRGPKKVILFRGMEVAIERMVGNLGLMNGLQQAARAPSVAGQIKLRRGRTAPCILIRTLLCLNPLITH